MRITPAHAERVLSHKAIEAIPDVGPHDSDAVAYWLVQLGAGLLAAAVVARAVVDPAQLAATATMSLTGRSLMAALAADVAAFAAARGSRMRVGV